SREIHGADRRNVVGQVAPRNGRGLTGNDLLIELEDVGLQLDVHFRLIRADWNSRRCIPNAPDFEGQRASGRIVDGELPVRRRVGAERGTFDVDADGRDRGTRFNIRDGSLERSLCRRGTAVRRAEQDPQYEQTELPHMASLESWEEWNGTLQHLNLCGSHPQTTSMPHATRDNIIRDESSQP